MSKGQIGAASQFGTSARAKPRASVGQSYLDNLRRLNASERVMKAAEAAVDDQESGRKKSK